MGRNHASYDSDSPYGFAVKEFSVPYTRRLFKMAMRQATAELEALMRKYAKALPRKHGRGQLSPFRSSGLLEHALLEVD